jgi:hypothetical protein
VSGDKTSSALRPAVRQWVAKERGTLEKAQSEGALARKKLDLRDAVEAEFPSLSDEQRARLLIIFDEELEAFCADMRLASVTVQQQVERKKPAGKGCLIALCIIVFLAILFVALATSH